MKPEIRVMILAATLTLSACAGLDTEGQRPSLSAADYERLRERIDHIAQLEHVSRELSTTLTELQVALARTYVAG